MHMYIIAAQLQQTYGNKENHRNDNSSSCVDFRFENMLSFNFNFSIPTPASFKLSGPICHSCSSTWRCTYTRTSLEYRPVNNFDTKSISSTIKFVAKMYYWRVACDWRGSPAGGATGVGKNGAFFPSLPLKIYNEMGHYTRPCVLIVFSLTYVLCVGMLRRGLLCLRTV